MELPAHIVYDYKRLEEMDLGEAGRILSEEEQAYLDGVSHEKRRREFIAGRILTRQLAGEHLQMSPDKVPLRVASDGSLVLTDTAYSVSLAHAQLGVCSALAKDAEIGIDLERIKARHTELHRFILHPEEYNLLETLDLDTDRTLILCWTLKEATLKAMKTGFRCSPKKLRLSVNLENKTAVITAPESKCWQAHFQEIDGHYLAVAFM